MESTTPTPSAAAQIQAKADFTLSINADSGYQSTARGRCTVEQYVATLESLHGNPTGAERALREQCDKLMAALMVLTDAVETRRPEHEGYLTKCAQDARETITAVEAAQ